MFINIFTYWLKLKTMRNFILLLLSLSLIRSFTVITINNTMFFNPVFGKPTLNLGFGSSRSTEYSSGNKGGRTNLSKKGLERDMKKEYGYKRDNLSRSERYEIEKRMGKSLNLR